MPPRLVLGIPYLICILLPTEDSRYIGVGFDTPAHVHVFGKILVGTIGYSQNNCVVGHHSVTRLRQTFLELFAHLTDL